MALPLSDINDAASYDKLPGIGAHPKNIHYWWARLPLPAARAVILSSIIEDPATDPSFDAADGGELEEERERRFEIIRRTLSKKPHEDPEIFEKAEKYIREACDGEVPKFVDPFSGGGSIPLEAQRLGLPTYASDLNPVAALLTKAFCQIPQRFESQPAVNPEAQSQSKLGDEEQSYAEGLAEDIRYYGGRILEQARRDIGDLYPTVEITSEMAESREDLTEHVGEELDVITWLWARTVPCPNPGCGAEPPLIKTFNLSTKKGNRARLIPIVEDDEKEVKYRVEAGDGETPPATMKRGGGECIFCETPIPFEHIRENGRAGNLDKELMAIVADGDPGRVYLSPTELHESVSEKAEPGDVPDTEMPESALGFRVQAYGMTKHRDIYTDRQLAALRTFSDLVKEIRSDIEQDAIAQGLDGDDISFEDGGSGALAYSQAVITYLAFAIDRLADFNCGLSRWKASGEQQMQLFARQAVPMVWDFAEANVLGETGITWENQIKYISDAVDTTLVRSDNEGTVIQDDIVSNALPEGPLLVSTDPPYYDNIGYAALSDFFYIWLRRTIGEEFPDLFDTILTPKSAELVASPHRFDGDKTAAKEHFENGFRESFEKLKDRMDSRFPITVYYAFKQDEDSVELGADDSSTKITLTTGWETVLNALLDSGFQITGTWPIRASQKWRMRATGSNALASYVVLACRPRDEDAPISTRREFVNALRSELPEAIEALQHGNIAPVDLAQAALGPGMSIFSRYSEVVSSDGSSMSVREALQVINQELDAYLSSEEGHLDPDTQFAVAWFEEYGFEQGPYGEAEVLFTAKGIAGRGVEEAGIAELKGGEVRLLEREELESSWEPSDDTRLTVWEATQQIIRMLETAGEEEAAAIISELPSDKVDEARNLAYRLYSICEKNGWADEALVYNNLVVEWPRLQEKAYNIASEGEGPLDRFLGQEDEG